MIFDFFFTNAYTICSMLRSDRTVATLSVHSTFMRDTENY